MSMVAATRVALPAICALPFLLTTASSAIAQTNGLYLESQPGDPIGMGGTFTYEASDATFSATVADGTVTAIVALPGGGQWRLDLRAPQGAPLVPGEA